MAADRPGFTPGKGGERAGRADARPHLTCSLATVSQEFAMRFSDAVKRHRAHGGDLGQCDALRCSCGDLATNLPGPFPASSSFYRSNPETYKRSYRADARYGRMWTERFGARLLEELTPAELERVKTERIQLVEPATVNRELAFLKHVYNVAIRDSKTERNPVSPRLTGARRLSDS
jgi:hypothetical protein